ncbi:MAG: sulfate ABC transporter permease subunit [Acidobacteria bacterium]|nr:MAG: sulfate ABC transporter permease subunit [Acidobacteriota bacterium]
MAEFETQPPTAGRESRRFSLPVVLVLLYTALLLLAPILAITWGALSSGLGVAYNALTSPDALHALKLTLILGVSASVFNAILGLCTAWVLVRDRFWGQSFLNGVIDLPFAISPVIAGLMLILLFGRGGWFEALPDALGMPIVFALPGMFLATAFVSLPFVVREVMPVLRHLGTEGEQAAYTLGASRWQAFWHVTLPAIRWGLLYGVSLTFARALGEFGAVLVVSGGVSGMTETATLFIFRSMDDRNYPAAYAMALVLALISFALLMVIELSKSRLREK